MATRHIQLNVPPSRLLWRTPSAPATPTLRRSSWGCCCVAAMDWRPPCMERIGTIASMAASITVGRPGANPPTHRELLMGMAR
jgi:fructokinase